MRLAFLIFERCLEASVRVELGAEVEALGDDREQQHFR
jgi:hypothetical protein